MNIQETGRVLAKAAAIDNRDVGEMAVLAWHEALEDIDYMPALRAVTEHRRTSDEYLLPIHIRRIVSEQRKADDETDRRTSQSLARCEHGLAGGALPHSITGEIRCRLCRPRPELPGGVS